MITDLQVRILRRLSPGEPKCCDGSAYAHTSKMKVLMGDKLLKNIAGKIVIDFGCGEGVEVVELAKSYRARRVIGVDIREDALQIGRELARAAGVEQICSFATTTQEKADTIMSLDAFEHFEDPANILSIMHDLLKPGGELIASFGPTWYHPLGGHLFSVFPWAHLLFSEQALIQWRSAFRSDGATRFAEVEGGLNRMAIGRFEKLLGNSDFEVSMLQTVPIRKLGWLHNTMTREFTTAVVRCRLTKRAGARSPVAIATHA